MTPTVDDRLASIVRALSEVILPHLPPEASLAQEQVQLCIGHIQILRAQIDDLPAYEQEELVDALALAKEISAMCEDPKPPCAAAFAELSAAIEAGARGTLPGCRPLEMRTLNKTVCEAIDTAIRAVSQNGSAQERARLSELVLRHEDERTLKDRRWFAPFGFDTL